MRAEGRTCPSPSCRVAPLPLRDLLWSLHSGEVRTNWLTRSASHPSQGVDPESGTTLQGGGTKVGTYSHCTDAPTTAAPTAAAPTTAAPTTAAPTTAAPTTSPPPVVIEFSSPGDVSDFDATKQQTVKANVASEAGVSQSAVTVTVEAASVKVTVTITTATAAQATSISNTLTASLSSAAAATAVLGVTVSSTPSVATDTGDSSGGGGDGGSSSGGLSIVVIAAAAGGGGAALVAGLTAYFLCRRKKKILPKDDVQAIEKASGKAYQSTSSTG